MDIELNKFLKDTAYNLLSLPKEDFSPLLLLAKENNKFQVWGKVTDLFKDDNLELLPQIKKSSIPSQLNFSFNKETLPFFLSDKWNSVQFKNIFDLYIDLIDLDRFLNSLTIKKELQVTFEKELYVVTNVLISDELSVVTDNNTSLNFKRQFCPN